MISIVLINKVLAGLHFYFVAMSVPNPSKDLYFLVVCIRI